MTSWKTVILFAYYAISFLLAILSFLKIYIWTKTSPLSHQLSVLSSKSETVDFPNFQNGMIVLSDAAESSGTYVWVVGGKAPGTFLGGSGGGSLTQPNFGTLVYNNTIRGYTWIKPNDFALPFITMNFFTLSLT